MNIAIVIAFIGIMVFLSHILAEVFSRTKIPDVLSLFLLGVFIGPVLNLVMPSDFGAVGPIFTTVTLIVMLFESGIGLHVYEILRTMRPAVSLTIEA